MAGRSETYTLKVDADLDRALAEVRRLERELHQLQHEDTEVEITADADKAVDEIDDLLDKVDKLDAEDAEVQLKLAQQDVGRELQDIIDQIGKVDMTDAEIDIKMAEGDTIIADIDKIDAKLKELDAAKAEVQVTADASQAVGDLEQAEGSVAELDGRRAEVVVEADTSNLEGGLGRARQGTDEIKDSARGAHSALANMIGNSAQDIGAMGGVAQSAGVALGQMAEYASDATLGGEALISSLGSMAMVAGPIALVSGAVALIGGAMQRAKEDAAAAEAQMERFTSGLQDVTGAAEDADAALQSAFDIGVVDPMIVIANEFQQALDPKKVVEYTNALAALNMTNQDYVDSLAASGGSFRAWTEDIVHANDFTNELTESQERAVAAAIDRGDNFKEIHNLLQGAAQDWANENQALVESLEAIDDVAGSMNTEQLAQNFLDAQRAIRTETAAVDEAIRSTNTYTDAAKVYLAHKEEQNRLAADSALRLEQDAGAMAAVAQATKDAAAETDRMTFTQLELADAVAAAADPMETLPSTWATLINDFSDGNVDITRATKLINELAEATGKEPGDILKIILEQAADLDEGLTKAAKGITDAVGVISDTKTADFGKSGQQINELADGWHKVSVEAAQASSDMQAALTDAGDAIADVRDEVLDTGDAIDTEFGKINDTFAGLKFDVDFQPALTTALDELDGFGPDLQTVADEWSTILAGQPIDIYGNVRADDAEFMDKVGNLRNLFQEGVVNAFDQGGVDAANTFVQSTAAQIAASTGLDIGEVYRIMGLGPDGSIETLIQPEVDAAAADRAASILDAIAGTGTTDPRVAALQIELEQGNVPGEIAEVAALLLAQSLGIPVSLEGIPQADIDAARAYVAGTTPAQIPTELQPPETGGSFWANLFTPPPVEVPLNVTAPDAGKVDKLISAVADEKRTATIAVKAPDAGRVSSLLDDVADDRTTTIAVKAPDAGAVDRILDAVAADRIADIFARANSNAWVDSVLNNVARDRTADITAVAHTSDAERALNNAARDRSSTVTQNVHTVTTVSSAPRAGRAATPAAAGPTAYATAAPTTSVYAPNIMIRTAVIGDRYDVQRVVTRAVRGAARLNGARALVGASRP